MLCVAVLLTPRADGSDDEYRLLRQNLFERLAGGSAVPSETPLVPVVGPPRDLGDGRSALHRLHHTLPIADGAQSPFRRHTSADLPRIFT